MIELAGTLEALGLVTGGFSLAQKRAGKLVSECFTTVERAEAWLEEGHDSYVCGNPVRPGCSGKPNEEDMAGDRILLIDCDPKKDPDKDPNGTSTERRDAAWDTAMAIWESYDQRGVLVDSGRGAQVWLRVEPGVNRRGFLSWLRDGFRHELVDIDATHDLSRLMRLPGSLNTRTGDEVLIIDPGTDEPIRRSEVAEVLEGWADPASLEICESDRAAPSRLDVRRYVTKRALEIWREDPMEITIDRSKRDFLFLVAVLENGAPLEAASRLLYALPGAKAGERSDENYWASTAASAARAVNVKAAEKVVIDELVERAGKDANILLEENSVRAMGRLYLEDYMGWAKLRAQIQPLARAAKISISDIDKVVRGEASRIHDADVGPPDDLAVFVRSEDGGKGSWKLRDAQGNWTWVSRQDVVVACDAKGLDSTQAVGAAMQNPFTITAKPFAPRILSGRIWNESNARYAVDPVEGECPTWLQLLTVVGRGLDKDIAASSWCRANGIETGRDYLFHWIGTMLKDPRSRRAYLFLYSRQQGTGKSLFFESMKFLIGGAVTKANQALQSQQGFNGELRGCVLAYTEEVNLARDGGRGRVYNRLKDWSLSETMSIHGKGATIFEVPNVISWGQAANDPSFCPIFDGDDRITIFQCEPPRDDEKMNKEEMREKLKAEAPAFLSLLLRTPSPKGHGRYSIPPISTEAKRQQARASRDDLSVWIGEHPEWILLDDTGLCDQFRDYLASRDLGRQFWPPQRILRSLPEKGDKAREIVQRLWTRPKASWTPGEAAAAFELGSAKRAGSIMRLIVTAWDRLREAKVKGATTFVLD